MISDFKLGGWVPDPNNKTYDSFDPSLFSINRESEEIDLRPFTSPRHDQRSTSTCVAQSTIKAIEIKSILKNGMQNFVPLSVLDVYYGARERMNPSCTDKDNGTHIYLACSVVKDFGVCRDVMHPFSVENVNKKPSVMASREARLNRISSQFKITSSGQQRLNDILFNLRAKNPVIFGTRVGKTWFKYTASSEPLGLEKYPEGGHAMCIVGYVNGLFIVENSWGTLWGENGFAYVKPEVFTANETQDIWVMTDGSEEWVEK